MEGTEASWWMDTMSRRGVILAMVGVSCTCLSCGISLTSDCTDVTEYSREGGTETDEGNREDVTRVGTEADGLSRGDDVAKVGSVSGLPALEWYQGQQSCCSLWRFSGSTG